MGIYIAIFLLVVAIAFLLMRHEKDCEEWKNAELLLIEKLDFQKELYASEFKQLIKSVSAGLSKGEVPSGLIFFKADTGEVYCSPYVVDLLCWPGQLKGFSSLGETAAALMKKLFSGCEEESETIQLSEDGTIVWMEVCRCRQGNNLTLALKNITGIVETKKKDLYLQQYDMLTGFLKRQIFQEKLNELLLEKDRIGSACMVLFELESLEGIDDSYGFSFADKYIESFAEVLRGYAPKNSVISRLSTDEFLCFFYGYPSKDCLWQAIERVHSNLRKACFSMNEDNGALHFNISTGVAWYPLDSEDPAELIRYAAFAVYIGRKTTAGRITEYEYERYKKDGYLINSREAFLRLIENRLVKYAFQPIVDVACAKIYGYEMLMRPQVSELKSPGDVLCLAKMQSKLHVIENITWFEGMRAFKEQTKCGRIPYNAKVFINSIGGAVLSKDEMAQLYEQFFDYLKNLVIEITETEQDEDDNIRIKREMAGRWGAQIAVDDYGSGYNSEVSLLYFQPDIVKVDMAIIQGVDHDANRQNILKNLIQYAKQRNIRVLAEGVETREELQTVIEFGVDYVQGYYLASPAFVPKDISAKQKQEIGRLRYGKRMKDQDDLHI